jgi:hypothetical protein
MKLYRAVEVQLHQFLTSEVGASELKISRPGHFTPWKDTRFPDGLANILNTIYALSLIDILRKVKGYRQEYQNLRMNISQDHSNHIYRRENLRRRV